MSFKKSLSISFICIFNIAAAEPMFDMEKKFLSQFHLSFIIKSVGIVQSNLIGAFKYCGDEIDLDVRGDIFGGDILLNLQSYDRDLILNSTRVSRPIHLEEAMIVGFVRIGLFLNIVRLSGGYGPDRAEGGIGAWINVPVVARSGNELIFDFFLADRKASRTKLLLDSRDLPSKRDQTIYFGAEEIQVIECYTVEMSCHV